MKTNTAISAPQITIAAKELNRAHARVNPFSNHDPFEGDMMGEQATPLRSPRQQILVQSAPNVPDYATRAFLNTPNNSSPASIRCIIHDFNEYHIDISDCGTTINLHGTINEGNPKRGIENFDFKTLTMIVELINMRNYVFANTGYTEAVTTTMPDSPFHAVRLNGATAPNEATATPAPIPTNDDWQELVSKPWCANYVDGCLQKFTADKNPETVKLGHLLAAQDKARLVQAAVGMAKHHFAFPQTHGATAPDESAINGEAAINFASATVEEASDCIIAVNKVLQIITPIDDPAIVPARESLQIIKKLLVEIFNEESAHRDFLIEERNSKRNRAQEVQDRIDAITNVMGSAIPLQNDPLRPTNGEAHTERKGITVLQCTPDGRLVMPVMFTTGDIASRFCFGVTEDIAS